MFAQVEGKSISNPVSDEVGIPVMLGNHHRRRRQTEDQQRSRTGHSIETSSNIETKSSQMMVSSISPTPQQT
jgi:hypothetical protein